MRNTIVIMLTASLSCGIGCIGCTPGPVVDRQMTSWHEMRDSAIKAIASDEDSKRWHFLPITGLVPLIGDVSVGGTPGSTCDLGEPKPRGFQPTPVIRAAHGVDAFAGLPIPNDLLDDLRAEGGFNVGKSMSLAYTEMSAEYIDDAQLRARIVDCLKGMRDIAETDLRIVRGIVSGRIDAKYGDVASGSANAKVLTKDVVRLTYTRDEGFELRDENPRPQFQIVAYVDVHAFPPGGLDEMINRISSLPADEQSEAIRALWEDVYFLGLGQPRLPDGLLDVQWMLNKLEKDEGIIAVPDESGRDRFYRVMIR